MVAVSANTGTSRATASEAYGAAWAASGLPVGSSGAGVRAPPSGFSVSSGTSNSVAINARASSGSRFGVPR